MHGVGIIGGCAALVASILEWDDILVTAGGISVVQAQQGIPEGGKLGPFGYCLIPDDLARALVDKCFGIGTGIEMPLCWKAHSWQGVGTPVPQLVDKIVGALRNGQPLPHANLLSLHPNLEASALRALDLTAPSRVPVVLHADDPFFVASSWGAMQLMLDFVGQWAYQQKVAFHVGRAKTALLNCTLNQAEDVHSRFPLYFPIVNLERIQLSVSDEHKWLGIFWNNQLDFQSALKRRIGYVTGMVANLAGMVASHTVPLMIAVQLFESKVEGTMRFGRWLILLCENAELLLNAAYERWARSLLGSPPWRSGIIASGELGWTMSGFLRGVDDVARRRAWLFMLPDDGLYRSTFVQAQSCSLSWSFRSLALLQRFSLSD